MSVDVAEERSNLAIALRAAARYDFNEGIDNHFSAAADDSGELFLLNRYGPHWSEVTESDILLVNLAGEVVEGNGECGIPALTIHCAVHRARTDARVVFHTHMPYATAVSVLEGGFDTRLSQSALYFHGCVDVLSFGGLATAAEEGERIAAAVARGSSVLIMQNHGAIVVGESVADAWQKLYFLERACRVQLLAQATGAPLVRVPEDVAAATRADWRTVEQECAVELFDAVRREVAGALDGASA